MSQDPYYSRHEVSNSDLTAFNNRLHPNLDFVKPADRERAFHLGTLVDGLVTEPENCNHYRRTVGDEVYTKEEWAWGKKMLSALRRHAKKDAFLAYVLEHASTQKVMVNPCQHFAYECFDFELPTRCKFDWWLENECLSGDLKTTTATTQSQFEAEIKFIGWAKSRAFYMMLAESINPEWGQKDFIYAISKKAPHKVFFKKIIKGDDIYEYGKQQVLDIAFRYWMETV